MPWLVFGHQWVPLCLCPFPIYSQALTVGYYLCFICLNFMANFLWPTQKEFSELILFAAAIRAVKFFTTMQFLYGFSSGFDLGSSFYQDCHLFVFCSFGGKPPKFLFIFRFFSSVCESFYFPFSTINFPLLFSPGILFVLGATFFGLAAIFWMTHCCWSEHSLAAGETVSIDSAVPVPVTVGPFSTTIGFCTVDAFIRIPLKLISCFA